jgi:hypothetical protein
MTEQEIIQNALDYAGCSKEWFDDKSYVGESTAYDDAHAFYDGAHSRDEEIEQLKKTLLSRANNTAYYAYMEGAQSMLPTIEELVETSNKWIKCSEQLPKKYDGRIRSNVVLVSITGDDWTVAEYHFGDKQWINLLGKRATIEPKYWQEVNLPE